MADGCPMQGQYEQVVNGHLLEVTQFGKNVLEVTPDAIGAFLYHLPDFRERLRSYPAQGNEAILAKLDELLANGAALAHVYRQRRKGQDEEETI